MYLIRTHIHTHTYIHTFIHTYIHTYVHMYVLNTYTHTHIHTTYIHTYIYTYIHTYIHMYIVCTYVCMYVCMYYIHTYILYSGFISLGANFHEWSALSFSRNFPDLEIYDLNNRKLTWVTFHTKFTHVPSIWMLIIDKMFVCTIFTIRLQ